MKIELESGIDLPEEIVGALNKAVKPKTPRKRATKKIVEEAKNPMDSLLKALKFVSVAQKKVGPAELQFSKASHNWLCASDGVLTIGHKIEEDLNACPHTLLFIEALSKVKSGLSITQLNERTIAVTSESFRGLVPCASSDEILITAPDENIATVDNSVKHALSSVLVLATEGAPNATYASVLLQANSAVATNGTAMLEYWHGLNLPEMLLPKAAAIAISKSPYDLTGFGYSGPSATFYFSNGSFIKTQLYGEKYPNYNRLLECDMVNIFEVPKEFFEGLKTIAAFSNEGNVYFKDGKLLSDSFVENASSYVFNNVPDGLGFNIKYLQLIEHAFKKAQFNTEEGKVYFHGENVRGVLMGLSNGPTSGSEMPNSVVTDDSDLPF